MNTDLFRGVVPFVAVAEELSFRKAAVRLGVTPAAVSKAVQLLEQELGLKLLQRTSRAVSLTRDGDLFLERCRGAVAAVAGARDEMLGARRAPQGEALVSAPFILAPLVVEGLVGLRMRHPRLTVRLQVTDQLARLAAEAVDVAVRIGGADDSSLIAHPLRRTRWATVAAPGYLARSPAPRDVDGLARHACLVFVAPNGRPRAWEFAGDRTVVPPAALLADHAPTLLDGARAGMGIVQVLDFMVRDDVRAGRLVSVLDEHARDGPPLRAMCTPGRSKSPNVKAIFQALTGSFSARA